MKKILAAFAAGVLACACVLAPISLATTAQAQSVYGAVDQQTADENAEAAALGVPVTYAQLTTSPAAAEPRDSGSRVDFTAIVIGILGAIGTFLLFLIRKAFSFLPAHIEGILLAWRVDQIIKTGFDNWAEKKAGEIRAKGVTLDMRNDAIAAIVRYGRDKAPSLVKNALGGEGGLEDRAFSRIDGLIDDLLARWVRQKDNLAAVAPQAAASPNATPSPSERA